MVLRGCPFNAEMNLEKKMISDKKLIEWGIAIGGSLLLHVVVIGAFWLSRSPQPGAAATSSPAAEAPKTTSTATEPTGAEETEDPTARGVATAGAKDVMDARSAMSDGDFEQSSRSTKPTKGGVRAKPDKTVKPSDKPVKQVKPDKSAKPGDKQVKTADKPAKPTDKPASASDRKQPEEAKPDAAKTGWKDYKVQRGESLTKIAQRCGCDIRELAKKNGLKINQALQLGQTIKIPDSAEK